MPNTCHFEIGLSADLYLNFLRRLLLQMFRLLFFADDGSYSSCLMAGAVNGTCVPLMASEQMINFKSIALRSNIFALNWDVDEFQEALLCTLDCKEKEWAAAI